MSTNSILKPVAIHWILWSPFLGEGINLRLKYTIS